MNITITDHANKRYNERGGMKDIQKFIEEVLDYGVVCNEQIRNRKKRNIPKIIKYDYREWVLVCHRSENGNSLNVVTIINEVVNK